MTGTIGVVGGGIMGCLGALALVRAGWRVVLFERKPELMAGASRGNEGKVHLGYTYGLDPTGATRDVMFRYGSVFEESLTRIIGQSDDRLFLNRRQYYAVHRDSSLKGDGVAEHMHALGGMLTEIGSPGGEPAVRRLGATERDAQFSDLIEDVWEVAEGTVDCQVLGQLVRAAVAADPRIEVQTNVSVGSISNDETPRIRDDGDRHLGTFSAVVNAAWDGMPRLERAAGAPLPDYCLRAKAGFIARMSGDVPELPVTTVYGTFGDVVPQAEGRAYVSWYPACLMDFTTEVGTGADWYDGLSQRFDYEGAFARSIAAFAQMIPGFAAEPVPERILGGPILAVAVTDIPDPNSKLHRRNMFGLHRRGNVIAVDTGKLTCGPRLALELAALIGAPR